MKLTIAALLLAAPALAVPPPDPFCTELRRLDAAAAETPAFASLGGASLQALLQSYCVVPPGSIAILCKRSLLPPEVTAASLVDRMRICLPDVRVTDLVGYWGTRVDHGRLRIDIAENGDERSHVGRTVVLYISTVS